MKNRSLKEACPHILYQLHLNSVNTQGNGALRYEQ